MPFPNQDYSKRDYLLPAGCKTEADEQFIDCKCPHCGFLASFPEGRIGTLQECPRCFDVLVVPSQGTDVGAKLPIPVKTSRLLLRRLVRSDSSDLLELMADEESFRYIAWTPLEEGEVEDWIEKDKAVRLTQNRASLCFGIELVEYSKLIGFLSLNYFDEERQDMAFMTMINANYRRQGFGSEAVRGALHFAFTGVHIHRVIASCDSRNIAGCRMLEKAGMRREGECVKDLFQKGEWMNTVWYAILEEEYEQPPIKY